MRPSDGAPPRSRAARYLPFVLALAALVPSGSCASNPLRRTGEVPKTLEREDVPDAIARSEAALEAGQIDLALEWAYAASQVEGLPTEQRNRVQYLMERAADLRVEDLSSGEGDAETLADLIDVGLPRQVAVAAGIRAARILVGRAEYKDAFDLIQRIDELYPRHHERQAAGELLAEIGLSLSHLDTGWWIFGRSRGKAYQALEYLVLNYPLDPHCAEAYWRLGEMYEEDGKWQVGIERLQELVVYHPKSTYVPLALARVPHLRLESIESPEYDRKALVLARQELEQWLAAYPGHELEAEVREARDDCLRRLSQSDLVIARFYRTVGNEYGARYHATRAASEAREAGDEDRLEDAEELLAHLGPAEPTEAQGEATPGLGDLQDLRGEAVRE